jgi:hypothetical protein
MQLILSFAALFAETDLGGGGGGQWPWSPSNSEKKIIIIIFDPPHERRTKGWSPPALVLDSSLLICVVWVIVSRLFCGLI